MDMTASGLALSPNCKEIVWPTGSGHMVVRRAGTESYGHRDDRLHPTRRAALSTLSASAVTNSLERVLPVGPQSTRVCPLRWRDSGDLITE